MASPKKILFSLELNGVEVAINNANDLAKAIKSTSDALKSEDFGTEKYRELEATLGSLKNIQGDVAQSARIMAREQVIAGDEGRQSYNAMAAELTNLRALYRAMTKEERDSPIGQETVKQIQKLDVELKELDAGIGNFQRNVGNYPQTFKEATRELTVMVGQGVPGFGQLANAALLVKDGIDGIGKTATATSKLLVGAFIGFQVAGLILDGVQAIKEFSAETNKLRGEIERTGNAAGEALDQSTAKTLAIADTFNQTTEEVFQAANVLSKNFAIPFNEALSQISDGFLAGADSNGKFLDAVIEMAPKAKAAGASLDQFGVALVEVGRAGLQEEEAIEGVIRQADEFTGKVSDMIDATNELTQRQQEQLSATEQLKAAQNDVAKQLVGVTAGFGEFGTRLKAVATQDLADLLKALGKLPAFLSGMKEAFKQFGENAVGSFRVIAIEAEILVNKAKRLNPLNSNDDQLTEEINRLEAQRNDIIAAGRSVADAFSQGYNDARRAQADKAAALEKDRLNKENQALIINQRIAAEKAAKELEAKMKPLRDAAKAAEIKYHDERLALLNELNKRLADATLAAMAEGTEKELAAERARFAAIQAEQLAQSREQEAAQLEARQKLIAAFGPNSPRVRAFEEQALADALERKRLAGLALEQEERAHLDRISEIRNAAAEDEARRELERIRTALDARQAAFAQAEVLEQTRLQERINDVLKSALPESEKQELILRLTFEADESSIQQEAVKVIEAVDTIQDRLDAIATDDTLEQASIEEYNTLTDQLDQYNLRRAELERQHTELVQAEARRREETRANEYGRALERLQTVVGLADQFFSALSEQELAGIEEQERMRNESIDRIQEKLKTATGQEKAQLEARLKNEQEGLKKLAKEREAVEKEERVRRKSFAIIQSLIDTALAVVKTIANLGLPAGLGPSILAGSIGLAQTAIIAAQPAAEGGLMGSGRVEEVTGLVNVPANIPTQRSGDNVLAMLKRGEVVLNWRQQAMLGGAPTFRAIQVPGFAEGGITGSIISAPDLSGVGSAERIRQNEVMIKELMAWVAATNARLDRLKVVVVSEDVREDLSDGDTLQARATLG